MRLKGENILNCERIKELRASKGFSLLALSFEIDIHPNTILRLEKFPNYNASVLLLKRYSEYFEVDINELIC